MRITALLTLSFALGLLMTSGLHAQEQSAVKVADTENVIIYMKQGIYAVFPYMPKDQPKDGVVIGFATRTVPSHTDMTGGCVVMKSADGCKTWNIVLEDKDCTMTEEVGDLHALTFPNGTKVSLRSAWQIYPASKRAELEKAGWEMVDITQNRIVALSAHSMKTSKNGGKSWTTKTLPMYGNSGIMGFHGGIITDQGICLYPVYGLLMDGDAGHSLVYRSADNGKTWTLNHIIADSHGLIPMNETSLIDLGKGHILAFVRTGDDVDHLFSAESIDGGVNWGRLKDTGITGHPSDFLRLSNGDIVLTYGYRHKPYGVRARISKDNGKSWGKEYIIRDDGFSTDVGYPMSIQLPNGKIFTSYYFRYQGGPTHIAGTLWREP